MLKGEKEIDMAHVQQERFCRWVQSMFPEEFSREGAKVLDCGSLDINGCNRGLFSTKDYTGIDLGPGRNVDVVSRIHEFAAADGTFDIVISTECLEHDRFWAESLRNMYRVCKPGGLMVLSCATTGRPEHGTRASEKEASPFTNDYYRNLTAVDLRWVLHKPMFSDSQFLIEPEACDLYFWGRKIS